jgi:glutathione S-transferase
VFSAWFSWLTSRSGEAAASTMDALLRKVDEELAVDKSGPYFLGEFSLIDIFFTPFLERMAASLPYFKVSKPQTLPLFV